MDYKISDGNLILPKGTTRIGYEAFRYRNDLEIVSIPEGVSEIGPRAFLDCKNLKQVSLPKSLRGIGELAFCGCKSLETIMLPEGLQEIKEYTFFGCENLKQVSLPKSLKGIGERAFCGCKSLETITLPEGLQEIKESAFFGCENLKLVNLPGSLVKIGKSAFGVTSCELVIIPPAIRELGEDAFGYCRNYVVAEKESAPNEYVRAILSVRGMRYRTISRPDGLLAKNAIVDGVLYYINPSYINPEGRTIISVPSGVQTVAPYAASGEEETKKICIPESVREIRPYAFANCQKLQSVSFANGIQKIGYKAFAGLKGATIELPDSVTEAAPSSFGEGSTFSMPGERENLQKIATLRIDIEQAKGKSAQFYENEKTWERELALHMQSRPKAFVDVPVEQYSVRIQQAKKDEYKLDKKRKWSFLLSRSAKDALLRSIEDKQNEQKALQAQQTWVSNKLEIEKTLADARDGRQKWRDRQYVLETEAEELETRRYQHLEREKKRILAQMGVPQFDKIPEYDYMPEATDKNDWVHREEAIVNQAFLEVVRIQNGKREIAARNKFVKDHAEDIARIRAINDALKRPADDGIDQSVLQDKPIPKGKLFPTCPVCFEKLNASYKSTASWMALRQAGEKIGCKKPSEETVIGHFFANNECICLSENGDSLVMMPFFAVAYRAGQSLLVFPYVRVWVWVNCEEKSITGTVPEGGEVIKQEYTYRTKNGLPDWRYKDNPLIKHVRFTRISISCGKQTFYSEAISNKNAEQFKKEFDAYAKEINGEWYKEAYALMPTADELGDFEEKIRRHKQKKALEKEFERVRKEAEKARKEAEKEKAELLQKLEAPVRKEIPTYRFKPSKAEADKDEANLLNEAYLAAVKDWNRYNRVTEDNAFFQAHEKEILRVKKINAALGCAEKDGISRYAALKKVPVLRESYFPQHIAKVNEYFSKTEGWTEFRKAWATILGTTPKALPANTHKGKFLMGNSYFCVKRESARWLFFPCFMGRWEENGALAVVPYSELQVMLESTEKTVIGEAPAYGELISERYAYLNKDGTPSRRYKENPLIRTVRLSGVIIGKDDIKLTLPFSTYREAAKMKEELDRYYDLFAEGMYAEIYRATRFLTDVKAIEAEIQRREQEEQKRIEAEKARKEAEHLAQLAAAKEEAERKEAERLAAQAAAEERRKELIQRQKALNEERKKQAEQKKKIYRMFEDESGNVEDKAEPAGIPSETCLEVMGNRMISNNVFKITVMQKDNFPAGEVTCYFMTKEGAVMSNRKKLSATEAGKESVIGFMLMTGKDYTQMKSCWMCVEYEGQCLEKIDFKMSIAFCPDF